MRPYPASKSFAASVPLLALLLACSVPGFAADLPPDLNALRTKAEGGNPIASYNLGLAYLQGRDIPADLPEAFVWLSLARESGNTGKALDSLIRQMSAAQLAEGQRRLTVRRSALAGGVAGSAAAVPSTTPSDNFARQQEELRAALADNKRLNADVATLQAEAAQAKAALTVKTQEWEKAKGEAVKAEAQKNAELATLRESLASAPAKAAAAEVTALKEQLTKSLAAQEQAAEKRRGLEAELTKLNQTAAASAAAEKKADAELERERAARLTLEQALAAQKKASEASALSSRDEATVVLALRQQLEAAQAATLKAESAAQELSAQKSAAEKSLTGVTTERDGLATRVKQAEAAARASADTEARIASLTKELEAARQAAGPAPASSMSPLQAEELAALRQRVATLESERSGLQMQLASARTPASAARDEAETAKLKKQLAETEGKLAAANDEVTKLRAIAAEEAAKPRTPAPASVVTAPPERVPAAAAQPAPSSTISGAPPVEAAAVRTLEPMPAASTTGRPVGIVYMSPTRPSAARAAEVAAAAAVVVPPPAPAPRTHIVRAGDTLSGLSRQYYGTADRWQEILNANRAVVKKPESLPLGGAIKIP